MSFIQFVAPLIGGYWFLWKCNRTKFVVKEDSGYHLFFKSSLAGILLLMLANLVILIADFFDETISRAMSDLIPNQLEPASILAMFIGVASPFAFNCWFVAKKELSRAAEGRGNYLFLLVQEAFEKSTMIEVTLDSGKVYIGSNISEMPFESEYLQLIPYFSGYREKESRNLIILKRYAEEIKSILNCSPIGCGQRSLQKMRVVIPTKDIASARLFDTDIFERLNNDQGDCV